ncbi:MAG: type II toxin-antitoxin system prevent-host-death family antitoxin [Shinella sp.]|jgi:prevent-host-death family protein|nr:type II toxin-antitoxin system prevent-host-death family antitoxin [Shinella sp.]
MSTVNMLDAKTQLSKLVSAVESGAENEIIIARNGRPAAKLVPVTPARTGVRLGLLDGHYPDFSLEEFDAMNDEILELFEGKE